MHGTINVRSPNNTSKWQMGFNSALKGLNNPAFTIKFIYLRKKHLMYLLLNSQIKMMDCSWNSHLDLTCHSILLVDFINHERR